MTIKSEKIRLIAIPVLLTIILSLFIYNYFYKSDSVENDKLENSDILDVKNLTDRKATFEEFSKFFEDTANNKGATYAFELMRVAPLPFGLDMHLLGHVVGDILYEQEGIDGMKVCTHDFRNACSHTIVIGALLEFGEGAFDDIRQACYDAPGGKGAYTMCFHGLGHGVLAYNDYDFPKTIEMCKQFSSEKYNGREGVECFGGGVMEIIGGGGHNKELWEEKRPEYLNPADPFAFCQEDYLPDEYRTMCYNYMTPYAFEALGADMGYPDPEIYSQTFDFCSKISMSEPQLRDACYGGLGKEFIGIATGRNFVPGVEPNKEQLQLMLDWCYLADEADGKAYCVASTVGSLYWGGEKPYQTALKYCLLINNPSEQSQCVSRLIDNVRTYIDDQAYREDFCLALPKEGQIDCSRILSL
jgi:hypothetical protein